MRSTRAGKLALVALTIGLAVQFPTRAEACTTIVPAGLVAGQAWTQANSPYCITGDVQVSLLSIGPGVEVLVDGPYMIEVLSTISAVGSESEPVRFAALDPLVPWRGLKFTNAPAGSQFAHCIIENANESGITLTDSMAPSFDDCVIRNNTTSGYGGGINADGVKSDLQLNRVTFEENTSLYYGGAARIKMGTGAKLAISDSVFLNNTSNPSYAGNVQTGGGALWLEAADDAVIANTTFRGNRSNSQCLITVCNPYGCGCSVFAWGGALYLSGNGNVLIKNSEFIENQTDAYINTSCSYQGNSVQSYGAAIYTHSATVVLENNIMSCNSTTGTKCNYYDGGGGIYVSSGTVNANNLTVARNADATGAQQGGGVFDIKNSIFFENNAAGAQIAGSPTVSYSDIQNKALSVIVEGPGNIDVNPVFAGPGCETGDLTIALGSPAIDAGDPDPAFDDECFPPSLGTQTNDMGAHGGPGACGWVAPGPNDADGDGVADDVDNCPATANADQADADGDSVGDVCDNCTLVANADQRDTNGDGFGNICDGDFDGNLFVGPKDLQSLKTALGQPGFPDEDLTGDGVVGYADVQIFKSLFRKPPGPSGLVP